MGMWRWQNVKKMIDTGTAKICNMCFSTTDSSTFGYFFQELVALNDAMVGSSGNITS